MEKLLVKASMYEYEYSGGIPQYLPSLKDGETTPYVITEGGDVEFSHGFLPDPMAHDDNHQPPPVKDPTAGTQTKPRTNENGETAILIAAENGVQEMVKAILKLFPVAIHDINSEKKNIVLLAVENKQPHVYQYLLNHKMKELIFRQTDKYGNNALHLAAQLRDHQPQVTQDAALQMQWEIKWYKHVERAMRHFHVPKTYNAKGETPEKIFTESHQGLAKAGGEWLTRTSESWSAVAVLIATVAFATSSAIPGGVKQESGAPTLGTHPIFSIFALSSPIALCFSVTSIMMFLAIRTSKYREQDFGWALPCELLVGITALFVSVAAMLASFFAGHFFVLTEERNYAAYTLYAVASLPVVFFVITQFPTYYSLARITFTELPPARLKSGST